MFENLAGLPIQLFVLFALGQLLLDGVEDLRFGGPFGFVGMLRCGGEIEPRELLGIDFAGEQAAGPCGERVGAVVLVEEDVQMMVDLGVDHLEDQFLAIPAVENSLTIAIDPLPLLVHHLVVFQQVLADVEVPLLDFLLAPSMRRLTMRLSIASPSCMPRRVRMFLTHSPAKIRIRSSSSDR